MHIGEGTQPPSLLMLQPVNSSEGQRRHVQLHHSLGMEGHLYGCRVLHGFFEILEQSNKASPSQGVP
jgi:hypothetical protein